jgi:predicted transcriptional regulator
MSDSAIAVRRKILQLVEKFPGLHLRDLARRAGLSEALAGYHMEGLEREGFVSSRFDAFYRRFYPVKGPAPSDTDQVLLGLLRQRVAAQIAIHLLEAAPATHTTLTKKLGLAKSTLSYHITKLQAANLVVVHPEGIRLKEPERVRRLLLTWRPPPDVTERFSDLWRKLYRSAR